MASFSTVEALSTLSSSIPEWNARLNDLNGQIASRQIELARLTEDERPPTRSLKCQGSTESLRPEDGIENPFSRTEETKIEEVPLDLFDTPTSQQPGSMQRPNFSAAAQAAIVVTLPPPKSSTSPTALPRKPSHPIQPSQARTGMRKRKTESLASGASHSPKYRTRSMIIVYYDSAVQTAFEELVKFVSGSRNNIRKSKMTAKMAQMRRAAEMEVDKEDEAGDDHGGLHKIANRAELMAAQRNTRNRNYEQGSGIGAMEADDGHQAAPQLRFVSTRQMGPSRDVGNRADRIGSRMSTGILREYGRQRGTPDEPDIFDEIDKGLEWCQGQCERAAHQFLRDGDCSDEIDAIKRRLAEVKETASKEMERRKLEEPEPVVNAPTLVTPDHPKPMPGREVRLPQMRKDFGNIKDLQVDDMEVDDDEGVDDLETPQLVFKRSRDISHP